VVDREIEGGTRVRPIAGAGFDTILDDASERWDQASVHEFSGTYGEYVVAKVSKVFPDLFREVV